MPATAQTCSRVTLGSCTFDVLTDGERFLGLGEIRIGDTLVRSGRLPLRPFTQSFAGWGLEGLRLLAVDATDDAVRIRLAADFTPLPIKMMRDHSFDPIHDLGDWDTPPHRTAWLDLVLTPANDTFGNVPFHGFAYHYEYDSPNVPLFFLHDQATWELDGDIDGATVYNQSSCSSPVVTFAPETVWSTEGFLFFLDENSHANRCMTHNLPRWTDHQCFDFQFKGDATLLGVYDRVELIRSVICRDAGKPELKCFDKHLFDETLRYSTVPKAILLNTAPKTVTAQQNLWTWVYDATAERARAEFGLKEQPPVPCAGFHYWVNFTIDTYYKDIVPACAAVGIRQIFAENFKRSDASEPTGAPSGNMCGSHAFEIAPAKGGVEKFTEYITRCKQLGIKNMLWTSNGQSIYSPLNSAEYHAKGWYLAMEDTRLKYGGAYTNVLSYLDLKHPEARQYFIDSHRKIVEETGLAGYYIDSHYNLFFMPLNYQSGHPQTMWRESLQAMKELQDAGVEWMIESFGPFGQAGHGHADSYDIDKIFISYLVGLGNNAVTVPVPGMETDKNTCHDPAFIYYTLAHKVPCALPLFIDGKRIDEVYGDTHRRILREYHELLPSMHRRYLQEDGQAVLWHNAAATRAVLWNFAARQVALPGQVTDLTTGVALPAATHYALQAMHTYTLTNCTLPTVTVEG